MTAAHTQTTEMRRRQTKNKRAAPKAVQCKACPALPAFATRSELREHQWAVHPETYAGTGRPKIAIGPARVWSSENVTKALEHAGNGHFTARDLLTELQTQQEFLNDVVSLITGIVEQKEAKR